MKALALALLLAPSLAMASPYQGVTVSTNGPYAVENLSGYLKIAASTRTYTVPLLVFDGPNGSINASSATFRYSVRAGSATFGGSSFLSSGALTLASGAALNLSASGGYILSTSSINASGFFGNGGGLTNVSGLANTGVSTGTYGSMTVVPSISIGSDGRITTISSNTISIGALASNNTWTGTNIHNSSATFNGVTNLFQKIASTTAVSDVCVGFTNLVASTTYVAVGRGIRNNASNIYVRANLDVGNNYYGGGQYQNGSTNYGWAQNGVSGIAVGDDANALAATFKFRTEVITDWAKVKRLMIYNSFITPNSAGDQFYGGGSSGGVYNGAATFSSLQFCATTGTWSGLITLYQMND